VRAETRSAALALAAALLLVAPAGAAQIEGVRFSERYESGATRLVLNGVGLLRYKLVFKGYVAALYLGDRIEPERALGDVPRRLEIEYFWPISARDFARATLDGVARNVDADTARRLAPQLERFNGFYRDVSPGDRYALTYVPGQGTELALNGEVLGKAPGAEFSRALFSIWLGRDAIDASLREQLLARR
jgi:hypothetical protein